MLEEKIADKNLLKIIRKFLKAGVIEEGKINPREEGTPQGGILSPTLSNIYLHYVLDLWIEKVIKRDMRGYVELLRYGDDFVILVQYKKEAEKILKELEEFLNKFGLDLSKEKTRLIVFGRYARINAKKKDKKPDTFDFLGFTHFGDKTRKGNLKVGRKTRRKKFNTSLKEINVWLKSVKNAIKTKEWWKIVSAKLRGHFEYYGISGNYASIRDFYSLTLRLIFKLINRRSQNQSMNWRQFISYLKCYPLPLLKIKHNIYIFNSNV